MKKVFSEIGFGNSSFFSTEFEKGKKEVRVKKFILPEKIKEFYFRIWVARRVLVISFFQGISFKKRENAKFKFLIGVGGESKWD